MKNFTKKISIYVTIITMLVASSSALKAQETIAVKEKPELIIGSDIVSSYVWRGVYQGAGPSIQPTLGVGYKGLSLTAWASTDFINGFKEIDFTLAYEIKGFALSVTDYWWAGEGSAFYSDYMGTHSLEAAISYTISDDFPLSIGWSTFFAGEQDINEDSGDRNFSTAITLGYDFYLKNDYTLNATLIVSPWASPLWLPVAANRTANFQVAAIQLTAGKDIKITDSYSLPVSLSLIASPATDDLHFVAAISF